MNKRRVKTLGRFVSAAGELSIPVVNVFTGPITWASSFQRIGLDISEERAWSVVVDSFSKIVEAAERNDVIVTVEAVFGMLVHDYYTMRELLDHFESKNLAVNLDPSHLVLYGNDPSWAVSRLGSRIKHIHVKDAVGRAGTLGEDFVFPFLGEGAVNWAAFFDALRRTEYSGYLSLEFENDVYLNNVCDGDWSMAARESKDSTSETNSEIQDRINRLAFRIHHSCKFREVTTLPKDAKADSRFDAWDGLRWFR